MLEADRVINSGGKYTLPVLPRVKISMTSQESKHFSESVPSTPHRTPLKLEAVELEFNDDEKEEEEEGQGVSRAKEKEDNEFESDEEE